MSVLSLRRMRSIKVVITQSIKERGSSIALFGMNGYKGSPNRNLTDEEDRDRKEDKTKRCKNGGQANAETPIER